MMFLDPQPYQLYFE